MSVARQLRLLAQLYPDVTTALDWRDPFELLVATVLAAQCTDARVNLATPALFARWPDAATMATATTAELEAALASLPLFRSKARHLSGLSRRLTDRYGGQVPPRLDELVTLPGVGRKTAQVVLAYAFGVPGVVVDTHCGRLARRLGWTTETDPVKVEHDLRALLRKQDWVDVPQRLVHHGRAVCLSQRPRCPTCALQPVCPTGRAAFPPAISARGSGRRTGNHPQSSGREHDHVRSTAVPALRALGISATSSTRASRAATADGSAGESTSTA